MSSCETRNGRSSLPEPHLRRRNRFMGKIIAFENVTLDGFMAGPNGEIDWAIRDDEVTQNSKEGNDSIDLYLFGRVTYDMMASFWPTPAGKSANPVFAEVLNNTPKIVFSTTLKKADWQNTEAKVTVGLSCVGPPGTVSRI